MSTIHLKKSSSTHATRKARSAPALATPSADDHATAMAEMTRVARDIFLERPPSDKDASGHVFMHWLRSLDDGDAHSRTRASALTMLLLELAGDIETNLGDVQNVCQATGPAVTYEPGDATHRLSEVADSMEACAKAILTGVTELRRLSPMVGEAVDADLAEKRAKS